MMMMGCLWGAQTCGCLGLWEACIPPSWLPAWRWRGIGAVLAHFSPDRNEPALLPFLTVKLQATALREGLD
jgi:hypothetical protein